MVPVEEVCYFQAADKHTSVVTRDANGRLSVRLKHRKESLPVSRLFADLFRPQ